MNETERKTIQNRLLDLAEERKTFFSDDGDDEVFREDYAALTAAAELIGEMSERKTAIINPEAKEDEEWNLSPKVSQFHKLDDKIREVESMQEGFGIIVDLLWNHIKATRRTKDKETRYLTVIDNIYQLLEDDAEKIAAEWKQVTEICRDAAQSNENEEKINRK